jgi:DNA-binding transcriptional LysR family regulator
LGRRSLYLANAPYGSIRAAAERLGANHATVLRCVGQLENDLPRSCSIKMPSGYCLTSAGEAVRALSEPMEAPSNQLEARVLDRDQSVRGQLRVRLSPILATLC